MGLNRKIIETDLDTHIGKRLWTRRLSVKLSREQLALDLSDDTDQIRKYELGHCRVPALHLWQIAEILDVRISWFFEGYSEKSEQASS